MLSGNTVLGVVLMLLSWKLLAVAQCPEKCVCRIDRNKHYIDCFDRKLNQVSYSLFLWKKYFNLIWRHRVEVQEHIGSSYCLFGKYKF
jgi:hypothetical protein